MFTKVKLMGKMIDLPIEGNSKWKNGKLITGENKKVISGIVMPLSNKDLKNIPAGLYDFDDRKLYTKDTAEPGEKVIYGGKKYIIKSFRNWEEADLHIYILKLFKNEEKII